MCDDVINKQTIDQFLRTTCRVLSIFARLLADVIKVLVKKMAIARDPVLEELRRSASLSASTSRKTSMGLAAADSTISLEGLEQADIGE